MPGLKSFILSSCRPVFFRFVVVSGGQGGGEWLVLVESGWTGKEPDSGIQDTSGDVEVRRKAS